MPRKPRFNVPGYPQHAIQRGNNREPCFFGPADCHYYLDCLNRACRRFPCDVHAYVLMTNHVHLLVTPLSDFALSQVMQSVGRRYVRYINHEYGRSGTLWEGRYKASLVDRDEYLLACQRYIEMNPVRAGMVAHPGDYPWSSYRHHAHGAADDVLTVHPLHLGLGPDAPSRQQAYRELFRGEIADHQLHEIRHALNHELALGGERFKQRIEETTKRRTRLGKAGRPRRS
jgi:putative transposase